MATWYVRPLTGNDANAGTSESAAWKTLTHAMLAGSSVAGGDTVRVEESPAPSSIGNCTWTDNSSLVTQATPSFADLAISTGWASDDAAATIGLESVPFTCAKFTITPSFSGSGKVGHLDLGATPFDFSAYQQISFKINCNFNLGTTGGWHIEIKLCSDRNGNTPVNSFSFDVSEVPGVGGFVSVVLDNGAALGASISSIAVHVIGGAANPATNLVMKLADNFMLCKAPSASDCITHRTLISKNVSGESWYGIGYATVVSGVGRILLEVDPTVATSAVYYGTTETVTTYKRECFRLAYPAGTSSPAAVLAKSGTSSAAPITVSGGWNSSNMTTQSGETFFDGRAGYGYGIYINSNNFITLDKLNLVRYDYNLILNSASDITVVNGHFNHAQNGGIEVSSGSTRFSITGNVFVMANCGNTSGLGINFAGSTPILDGATITAKSNGGPHVKFNTQDLFYAANTTFKIAGPSNSQAGLEVLLCGGDIGPFTAHRTYRALQLRNTIPMEIRSANIDLSSEAAVYLNGANVKIPSFTTANNNKVVDCGGNIFGGSEHFFGNCSIAEATKVNNIPNNKNIRVKFGKIGGDYLTNETYSDGVKYKSDKVDRNTASDASWRIEPTSATRTQYYPGRYPNLCRRSVTGGSLCTFSGAAKRSSSTVQAQFRILGGRIAGIPNDIVIPVTSSGTWNTYTTTFTPSEDGVVEAVFEAWGGTTDIARCDDVDISQ